MTNNSTALQLPALAAVTVSSSPVVSYMAKLESNGSKLTARRCLRMVAVAVGADPDKIELIDWSALRYEHILAIRGILTGRGLAPATINLTLSVLRGIARQCWLLEQMDERAYKLIHEETKGVKGHREQKGRMIPMKDVRKILRACDDGTKMGKRDAAIIAILLGAGLRRSEVAWVGECEGVAAFDFEAESVKVIGKGNKEREVFLFGGTLDVLRDWLDVKAGMSGVPLFPAFMKFDKPYKRGVSPQAIYDMLRKRCLEAGIAVIRPHDFRRTNISTQLEQCNGDVLAVSNQAGHASTDTTKRYDLRGAKAQKNVARKCSIPL